MLRSLALAAVICLTGMTVARNRQYRDVLTLWQDTTAKSLEKPRVRLNLGRAYQMTGDGNRAMHEFENAMLLAMAPGRPDRERMMVRQFAAVNMGEMLMSTGNPQATNEAERIMSQVWNEEPGFPGLANNLAVIYALQGRYAMAIQITDLALTQAQYYPSFIDNGKLLFNRAMALKAIGRCEEAVHDFKLAAAQSPDVHAAGPQQCP